MTGNDTGKTTTRIRTRIVSAGTTSAWSTTGSTCAGNICAGMSTGLTSTGTATGNDAGAAGTAIPGTGYGTGMINTGLTNTGKIASKTSTDSTNISLCVDLSPKYRSHPRVTCQMYIQVKFVRIFHVVLVSRCIFSDISAYLDLRKLFLLKKLSAPDWFSKSQRNR